MCNEPANTTCIGDILAFIISLQHTESQEVLEGCSKPYLGPCTSILGFNTRPINLYNCCTGNLWSIDYTLNGTTGTSSIFRAENVDENCCTCRVLIANPDTTQTDIPYIATDTYFTINLNCVGVLKCLPDAYVPC